MRKTMDSKTIINTAVKKMLGVLGLHIIRQRINRIIDLVSESSPGTIRKFKDQNGNVMAIRIYESNRSDFAGVFPNIGMWTYFKNDNQATFDVFTKSIREYSFENCPSLHISNPFFGCRSPEEVIVNCDLIAEQINH